MYLTGVPKPPVADAPSNSDPVGIPGVSTTWGRPHLFTLLSLAAAAAKAVGEARIAVLVCGSRGVVDAIQDAVDTVTTGVALDVHSEVLSF